MMKRIIIIASSLLLASCAAHNMDTQRSELNEARDAIAAAKAAGAEKCATDMQAEAVASYYWAAHELTESPTYHAEEISRLLARATNMAKQAKASVAVNCPPPPPPPPPAPAPKPAPVEIIKLNGVNFAHDSAALTTESKAILDEAVATLKRRDKINVEVAAHTDSQGRDSYNQALSERRAASVLVYLETHGIDAGRLSAKGYGESMPIASNKTREGRAQNRRVELRVVE